MNFCQSKQVRSESSSRSASDDMAGILEALRDYVGKQEKMRMSASKNTTTRQRIKLTTINETRNGRRKQNEREL